jgi:WD40 repeat protein
MTRCASADELARLLAGELSALECETLDTHLTGCPDCQRALAQLSDGEDVARWRGWVERPVASVSRTTASGCLAKEAAGPAPAVPGYEILGEVGRGGAGVVYRARQLSLDRPVVLKVLLAGALAGPEDQARFFREAEAAARLQHPHLVQVHEVGRHGELPFLAMEYVEGGSLAERLAGTPQPPRLAAELVEKLARAVQHAHGLGIIHRDLKPANVLLSAACGLALAASEEASAKPQAARQVPKITDFGLAKRLDGGASLTETGAVMGTPSYMAPEQAQGKKDVGPACDIYALGAILYEMLTGRPAFRAETPYETLVLVVHHDPVPPRQLQPRVPIDLETICLKCLEKDPARRYPTAGALADDLVCFLEGRPIRARAAGLLEKGCKWMRRSPSTAALVLLGVLVVAVGLPLVTFLWLESVRANRIAVRERSDAEDQRRIADELRQAAEVREARLVTIRGLELCDTGDVPRGLDLLAGALEMADRLPGQEALGRAIRVNLAEWADQVRRPGPVHSPLIGKVNSIQLSPDGKTLLLGGPNGVHCWDPEGKRQQRVMLTGASSWVPSPPTTMTCSSDGKLVAAGYHDGKVRLWDLGTGKQKGEPLAPDRTEVWALAFHPGGKVLASSGLDSIQFWDPATGKLLHREPYPKRVMHLAYSPDGQWLAIGDYGGQGWLWPMVPGPGPGREGRRSFRHTLAVTALSFDPRPERRRLATASRDGTVRFWEVPTGRPVGRALFHADEVRGMAWSIDGRWLLTGCKDQTAQLWDADTLAPIGAPWRLDAEVAAVGFASAGTCVISTSDGRVHFWHLPQQRKSILALKHGLPAEQVGFWSDTRMIVTAGWGAAGVWTEDGEVAGIFKTADRLRHVAWARRAGVLVSAHWFQDVERWRLHRRNTGTFRVEHVLPPLSSGKQQPVVQVALSPDGSTVYAVREYNRRQVHRWDLSSGRELPGPIRYPGAVWQLVLSPDGRLLGAIVHDRNRSGVWLRPADEPEADGHGLFNGEWLRCLGFSRDSGRLAVGCRSGRVCLWDVQKREQVRWSDDQDHHRGEVRGVAFSPDGRMLLSGGTDGRGRFWDVATGLPLGPPLPHSALVLCTAFRDDGQVVLTGCQDSFAYGWRVPRAPLPGSVQEVRRQLSLDGNAPRPAAPGQP